MLNGVLKELRALRYLAATALALMAGSVAAQAANGPYQVEESSYRFPGRDEPLVTTDRKVDLWAEVYRPASLTGKALPVIIFQHGNHGTCGYLNTNFGVRVDNRSDYTTTGACPDGYTVTPNHLGYAYLAQELASWGYMVVSINANRGITAGAGATGDAGLNLMRGRLILRHLALLEAWNNGSGDLAPPDTLGFDPRHTMDFSQVGLMGHSRGGEGIRAALQQYRDQGSPFAPLIPDLNIRSLFEIGPVDGQTSRVLDADGVNSMVLLPSCDGDVINLQGVKVFDRVFLRKTADPVQAFHGTVYVYGADHNAFNSEWLIADSSSCSGMAPLFPYAGTSAKQQAVALQTLVPFFRATVGSSANKTLASFFDPTSPIPTALSSVTKVDRGYLPVPPGSNTKLLETFSQPTGTSDQGVPTTSSGVTVVHQSPGPWIPGYNVGSEHASGTMVANVSWTTSSPRERYFQVNFAAGTDMSASRALSFRTGLRCFGTICNDPTKTTGEMTYGIQLLDSQGKSSNTFTTSTEVRISRPQGTTYAGSYAVRHQLLGSTVSIPVGAFRGVDMTKITAVRFVFENQTEGSVDLTDLALLKTNPVPTAPMSVAVASAAAAPAATTTSRLLAQASPTASQDKNTLTVVRKTALAVRTLGASKAVAPSTVDVVLTTERAFPVTDAFPKLKVDGTVVEGPTNLSADGKTMTITLPKESYDSLPANAPVSLQALGSQPAWQFGTLNK